MVETPPLRTSIAKELGYRMAGKLINRCALCTGNISSSLPHHVELQHRQHQRMTLEITMHVNLLLWVTEQTNSRLILIGKEIHCCFFKLMCSETWTYPGSRGYLYVDNNCTAFWNTAYEMNLINSYDDKLNKCRLCPVCPGGALVLTAVWSQTVVWQTRMTGHVDYD